MSTSTKAFSAAVARHTQFQAYPTADVLTPASRRRRNHPAPASPAAVPASSTFQHLQTSFSFTRNNSYAFQLLVPADQLQLHQQPVLRNQAISTNSRPAPASPSSGFLYHLSLQRTEAISTHSWLTKVPPTESPIIQPLQPVRPHH